MTVPNVFFSSFFFKMKKYTRYECTRALLNIDEYALQNLEKSISERYNWRKYSDFNCIIIFFLYLNSININI
jgi:hypothetical protein